MGRRQFLIQTLIGRSVQFAVFDALGHLFSKRRCYFFHTVSGAININCMEHVIMRILRLHAGKIEVRIRVGLHQLGRVIVQLLAIDYVGVMDTLCNLLDICHGIHLDIALIILRHRVKNFFHLRLIVLLHLLPVIIIYVLLIPKRRIGCWNSNTHAIASYRKFQIPLLGCKGIVYLTG